MPAAAAAPKALPFAAAPPGVVLHAPVGACSKDVPSMPVSQVATVMVLMCTRPLPPGLLAGNTWVMPVVTCGEPLWALGWVGMQGPSACFCSPCPAPCSHGKAGDHDEHAALPHLHVPCACSPDVPSSSPAPPRAAVIGREITMSALREWAAALGPEAHSAVAVSWVGKWKTATQVGCWTRWAD